MSDDEQCCCGHTAEQHAGVMGTGYCYHCGHGGCEQYHLIGEGHGALRAVVVLVIGAVLLICWIVIVKK